jgi:sodium pump decarboxylase gamma subunit
MRDVFDGLFLMCVGMGTVFLFLGLMIGTTELIRRVFGGPPAPASAPSPPPSAPRGGDEALEAAAVTAAIRHHRRKR